MTEAIPRTGTESGAKGNAPTSRQDGFYSYACAQINTTIK